MSNDQELFSAYRAASPSGNQYWFESVPCTCDHDREFHDLGGCRHQYLSVPPCRCPGVFGIVDPDR